MLHANGMGDFNALAIFGDGYQQAELTHRYPTAKRFRQYQCLVWMRRSAGGSSGNREMCLLECYVIYCMCLARYMYLYGDFLKGWIQCATWAMQLSAQSVGLMFLYICRFIHCQCEYSEHAMLQRGHIWEPLLPNTQANAFACLTGRYICLTTRAWWL